MGRHHSVSGPAGALGCGDIEIVGQRFQPVIRQRKRLRIEGVGFDQIGARFQVLLVDVLDNAWLREAEQIVQALEVSVPLFEPFASIGRFVQLVLLYHRTHCAIENHNSFAQQTLQLVGPVLVRLHYVNLVKQSADSLAQDRFKVNIILSGFEDMIVKSFDCNCLGRSH